MSVLIKNGKIYGDHSVTLTQAQYDALSTTEKNNGTVYYITDGTANYPTADSMRYQEGVSVADALDTLSAGLTANVVGFPDYSNRTSMSSGDTCEENGWIQVVRIGNYVSASYPSKVYINGIEIFNFIVDRNTNDIYKAISELVGPVKKGDIITFSNVDTVYFMPFR